MKNNLISAIAGWKSAALLALVAMVAAVAFSGVLTSTSADAQNGPALVVDGLTLSGTDVTGSVSLSNPSVVDPEADPVEADGWSFSIVNAATNAAVATACRNGSTTIVTTTGATQGNTEGTTTGGLPVGASYAITAYDEVCAAGDIVDTAASVIGTFTIPMLPANTANDAASPPGDLTASPGGHVDISFAAPTTAPADRAALSLTSDGADGSFAATGKAALTCTDDNACDLSANVDDLMTVRVNVGEDSTKGQNIYVTFVDATYTIRVIEPAAKAASFTAEVAKEDASVAADGTASATIVVTVKDDQTPAENFGGGHNIIFVTTDGDLKCGSERTTSKTCSETSGATGTADAEVSSATPGTVTVTVLAGALGAKDVEVTFFGAAADVSASSEQSSVEYGGSLTVTLTVTDADGRAVVGAAGAVRQPDTDAVEKPADDAKGVTIKLAAAEDEEDPPQYCAGGTDGKGQCVAVVSAAGPPDPATGGAWTFNFELASTDAEGKPATLTESFTLTVAGPPHDIANDAEERYNQREVATVTLTVTDEDGNLVGTQPISVNVVDGSVALLDDPDTTKNGEASFTFVVRSNATGSAAFLARSGDAASIIEVAVGPEPVVVEVDEEPEGPPPTWNNELVSGTQNVVWNGDDGADPADGAAEGVTAIWQWNGSGWDGYFPAAADVPGGNTLDSLSNGEAYWVIVE